MTASSRRQFIARILAGAMASNLAPGDPLAAAALNPKAVWRPRLTTSSIHFKTLPIEQACERIAGLGFEAIDLWCAYEKCPHLDDAWQRLGPDGLNQLLSRHKLALASFSTYVGGYAKYAELLGKAGGGMAVQGGPGPVPSSELTSRMRAFLESLKPLVELAEKHRSYLAIENHGQSLLDSLDSFKAFVDLNPSPRLGLALAPYHLQATGASVEEAIAISGRHLFFFYAWQKQDGAGQLPGHGPIDFTPWLRALGRIHFNGPVNPFMHGHLEPDVMSSALAKARTYLVKTAQALS